VSTNSDVAVLGMAIQHVRLVIALRSSYADLIRLGKIFYDQVYP
jgi:hypothetical protein